MAYNVGDPMFENGVYIGNYMGGPVPTGGGLGGASWGTPGTPQGTTSQGVPTSTGFTAQLDQVSPVAQQMWADYQRQLASQPAQQPYDYSAGASFGGASAGSPVLPTPVAQETTKPMTYTAGGLGGMGGTGGTASVGGQVGFNPNLGAYSDDITRRTNQQRDQALLSIRGNFIGQGGLGSGRQALAEASAISGTADNLAGQLAGMNLQDWTGQQNRNLTQQGMRDSFYTSQRGQDLQAAGLGAGLLQQGLNSEWTPYNQANQTYGTYGGNGTTTQNQSSGGGWMGGLGGALGVANLAKQMGWWS